MIYATVQQHPNYPNVYILLTMFRPKFSVLNVRVIVGAFNQALKGAYSLIVKLRLKLYWTYSRTWTRDGSGAVPRPRHCEVSAQFAASGADMPRHQPSGRHHHHCLCLCHCLLGTSPLSSPHIASPWLPLPHQYIQLTQCFHVSLVR